MDYLQTQKSLDENQPVLAQLLSNAYGRLFGVAKATLELVYNLRQNLRINQNLESDDRELIILLEPLYQQEREKTKQEG